MNDWGDLGDAWRQKAERNVEEWGQQRHDTLLLALIEEVGEIAMAMETHNGVGGGPHPFQNGHDVYAEGRRIIGETADLGRRTQEYLDEHGGGRELHGPPKRTEPILEEIDDAAALMFQLRRSVETAADGGDGDGD